MYPVPVEASTDDARKQTIAGKPTIIVTTLSFYVFMQWSSPVKLIMVTMVAVLKMTEVLAHFCSIF